MLDKEFHIRFKLADVGKAICFSPVIVVLIFVLICLPWDSKDAAAWVQAVGSVTAIFVAIWVASSQTAFQVKMVRDRETQLLRLAIPLARHVAVLIEQAARNLAMGPAGLEGLRVMLPLMEEWDVILEEIPLERLPNPEAAAAWIEIRQSLRGARRSTATAQTTEAFLDREGAIVGRMHEFAVAAVKRLEASSVEYLPDLKVNPAE